MAVNNITYSAFPLPFRSALGNRPTVEGTPASLDGDNALVEIQLKHLVGPGRAAIDKGIITDGSGLRIIGVVIHQGLDETIRCIAVQLSDLAFARVASLISHGWERVGCNSNGEGSHKL